MESIYHTQPPEKVRQVPDAPAGTHHPGRWRDIALLVLFFAALALLVGCCAQVYLHPEEHYPNRQVERPAQLPGSPGQPGQTADPETAEPEASGTTLQPVTRLAANTGKAGAEVEGADAVVARWEDASLSNQTFLYYYWDSFYSLYDYFGEYLTAYLRFDQPFDQQQATETQTWNEYIATMAADSWYQTQVLARLAKEAGHTLTAEEESSLAQQRGALEARALEGNYGSIDAYLQLLFDPSADLDSYMAYQRQAALAHSYVNRVYQDIYEENYDPDAEVVYDIQVRHILLTQAEGEEASALADRAEALYQQWLQDPTEDYFAQLAQEHSEDPGSASNGGLYADVYPGQMVTPFNDWCFDEARQPGDSDIVETSYGCHLMYFVGQSDTVYYDSNADRAEELYDAWLDDAFAAGQYDFYLENAVFTEKAE